MNRYLRYLLLALAVLCAPAAYAGTVTNLNDSGPGSLRDAIAAAGSGETITFSVTGTITLTSGPLTINKNLTIQGPFAALLTISGNNASRVFDIGGGVVVTAVWVFDSVGSNDGWTITPQNDRSYLLELIRQANQKIANQP